MGTDALDLRRINVDRFLTQLSVGTSPPQNLIGDKILPVLKTELSVEKILKFGTEAYRMIEDEVGDFSEAVKLDTKADKISVEVDGHAAMTPISLRQSQESLKGPAQLDLERRNVYVLKSRMALRREKLQADLVQNAALYAASHKKDLNGLGKQWDDDAVDPFDILIPLIEETLPVDCGERPNTLAMGQQCWSKLILNAKIKNRIYGLNAPQGVPTTDQVANLLGLPPGGVVVGRTISKTAAGVATYLWGKTAVLCYVPPVQGQEIPAFGYTVEQMVFGAATEALSRIEDQKMGASGGWWIKRGHFYTPTMTLPEAGAILQNVVQ